MDGDDTRIRAVVVQEATRSLRVTIPRAAAEEVDVDSGETLLVKPEGDEIRFRKAESIWSDD